MSREQDTHSSSSSHENGHASSAALRAHSSAVEAHLPSDMLNRRADAGVSARGKDAVVVNEPLAEQLEKGTSDLTRSRSPRAFSPSTDAEESAGLSARDKKAITLLVVLYALQGVPVGLAFGSIPFLLRAKLSYSQIGLFTLCTYPYSLKLLWSPIVDSFWSPRWGRRRTWILPIQACVGFMLWWLSTVVPAQLEKPEPDVAFLTAAFFALVFCAATQDIAVDGWALTLLSQDNLSYASTAQTVGLNSGYFLSFTVFLAFNSVEFSNSYFRSTPLDYPLLSLKSYLQFWAVGFVLVTAYLAVFEKEENVHERDDDMGVKKVYQIMREICSLKHVQSFLILHLVTKFGTATNDAATSLKLLERGLKKEDLALAVLIDFPFQLLFGYLAGKWSKGEKPLRPWLIATWSRLGWAVAAMLLVRFFPQPTTDFATGETTAAGEIGISYFLLVIFCTVGASFSSTVQFVGVSAFHTQIADPVIGGTYMTLLNTVSNLGGTWPRFFVLKGIDFFSQADCVVQEEGSGFSVTLQARECVSEHGKAACADLGGECITTRDGYYWMSSLCVAAGAVILVTYVGPAARKLQNVPLSGWRIRKRASM